MSEWGNEGQGAVGGASDSLASGEGGKRGGSEGFLGREGRSLGAGRRVSSYKPEAYHPKTRVPL